MQNGGVQVMDVDRILRDLEAEIVGGAVDHPGFNTASGQQVGKAVNIVVPAVMDRPEAAEIKNRCSAEFASDENQGFVEEAAFLQVLYESGNGHRPTSARAPCDP